MEITVVIPVYNEAPAAVRDHIDMLVRAGADEIILVDDGSVVPVTTVEGRVKFSIVKHNCNLGVPAALNTGLHYVRTSHVLFSAIGDVLDPFYFGELKAYVRRSLAAEATTFTARAKFKRKSDGFSVSSNDYGFAPADSFGYYYDPRFLAGADRRGQLQIISHATVFFTEHAREVGFLRPLHWHCDWFLTHCIAYKYGLCFFPAVAAHVTIDPASYSGRGMRNWRMQFEIIMWARNFTRLHDHGVKMKQSGAFGFFGWPAVLYALCCDRELFNLHFLRKAGRRTLERFIWRFAPAWLLRLMQ
jgi:glycosyltransferase involved in cell wall biosynthesis